MARIKVKHIGDQMGWVPMGRRTGSGPWPTREGDVVNKQVFRGDIFEIEESKFSPLWMERLDPPATPEKPKAEVTAQLANTFTTVMEGRPQSQKRGRKPKSE